MTPCFESYIPGNGLEEYVAAETDEAHVSMVWRVRRTVFARDPYFKGSRVHHVRYASTKQAHNEAAKLRTALVKKGDHAAILRWFEGA